MSDTQLRIYNLACESCDGGYSTHISYYPDFIEAFESIFNHKDTLRLFEGRSCAPRLLRKWLRESNYLSLEKLTTRTMSEGEYWQREEKRK